MKRILLTTLAAAVLIAGAAYFTRRGRVVSPLPAQPAEAVAKPAPSLPQSEPSKAAKIPLKLVDLTAHLSPRQYVEKIDSLGHDLSQQEQETWIAWINGPKPPYFKDGSWNYVVNEVMGVLCQQHQPCPNWTQALIEITRNKTNDPVMRDYAIQHLVDWIVPADIRGSCEVDPEKRRSIIETILEAAGQTDESYSGTALQGLHIILQNYQRSEQQHAKEELAMPFTIDQLRPVAVHLAVTENADMLARITALQVCAERGFTEILPQAREIASTSTFSDSIRLSAIAALGRLGTAEDQPLLQQILQTVTPRLQEAARPALESIKQRAVAPLSMATTNN